MKAKRRHGRAWLLATAKAVATKLKMRSAGTRLRIRRPKRTGMTDTDGWYAVIGNLGKNQPQLEIWFDRFSGYPERKLCACFRSEVSQQVDSITKYASRKLWPIRVITLEDTTYDKHVVLRKRLRRSEFNAPLLEKYRGRNAFYGIYDLTRGHSERSTSHFCTRAVAFFEDVARALPHATDNDQQREVYPQFENRKRVVQHLRRERSRLLAIECKIRDNYECQVCGLRFEETYGILGAEFAEAHHRIPLKQLREQVKTQIGDLSTVCANCHRMLHRLAGERNDVEKLRATVRKRRRKMALTSGKGNP